MIYQVALPVPLRRLFDYLPPIDCDIEIKRGMRVKVPFGRRHLTGIVMHIRDTSEINKAKLKKIALVYDDFSIFPEDLCIFLEMCAKYYHYPLGEVIFTGVPLALKEGKAPQPKHREIIARANGVTLPLNEYQQTALDAIIAAGNQFQPFLLEGITGSGKTEVYLQACEQILQAQKQVLILVPEISLTPQTQKRFIDRFGDNVMCFHSGMTPSARWEAWLNVREKKNSIIVGTRSAIFLPFQDLGLIIIDEEHDASFKQQEGFRYSARDVALFRAKQLQCPIILGTATPSFESIVNAEKGKYKKLILPNRATQTSLPAFTQIDIRHNKLDAGLSAPLIAKIKEHIKNNGQVLLFINRRGYAPTLMCFSCGWMAKCKNCDARLTYHDSSKKLICHHCLYQTKAIEHCPVCVTQEVNPVGQGTQRLESMLKKHFPDIGIARIDSDMTRKKGSLDNLLAQAEDKTAQILIGTQILAKGHHFPHLSLVAIVDGDTGLFSTDFRAIERMAQLIIQVAGRAGRVHNAAEVVLQTVHPEHPLLQHIVTHNYPELAQTLLQERKLCHLPPYSFMALIRVQAKDPNLAQGFLKELLWELNKVKKSAVKLLGPVPAPMLKRQGQFRFQLLMQSPQRQSLHQLLSYATSLLEQSKLSKKVRWSLDVDPIEMF